MSFKIEKTGFNELRDGLQNLSIKRMVKNTITRWILEQVITRAKQTTGFEDRTGLLRVTLNIINVTETAAGFEFIVGWGGAAPYGKFQEYGTKTILPRRFMMDAAEREIASLPGYWVAEFDSEVNAAIRP